MDQLKSLFVKYRQVLKTGVLLCAVIAAIFSKTEKVRFLSLGVASGILVIEFAESVDRLKRSEAENVTEE